MVFTRADFDNSELDCSASPGLLERRGNHRMRDRARVWCRAHPDEAAALPEWKPGLLRAILNEKPVAALTLMDLARANEKGAGDGDAPERP